jgi:hypothetical protein
MQPRVLLLLFLVMTGAACATGTSGSGEPRSDRNMLQAADLEPLNQFTAWDAVQRLRPMWMRPGGIRNSANPAGHYPHLFVDGSPYGAMEALRSFRVENIQEMRYVNATDATIRYGGMYQGGVILISTKRSS